MTTLLQPAIHTHHPTWWRSPQRLFLRRALFQLHLWLGLVLAAYAIVIGLSGSALVFQDRLNTRELHRFHLDPHPTAQTLAQTLQQLQQSHPGWRIGGLNLPDDPSLPLTAYLYRVHTPSDANYRAITFDPRTAHVFRDRMRFDGPLGWLTDLHFNLLAGRRGLLLSGWMALGLLLLCLSGLLLWWPGIARCFGALILRLHRHYHRRSVNLKRLNWDLHAVVGFWTSAALILVTVTGLYFAFPTPIRNLAVLLTGGSLHQAALQEDPPTLPASPATRPLLTVDQILAAARQHLPANAPPGYLAVPLPGNPWYVTGYYRGALPFSRLASLTLDPRTGKVLRSTDTTREMPGLRLLQYIFTFHFGSFGGDGSFGTFIRLVWMLLGLAPTLLAVTGVLMFWNRKLRPRRR